MVIEPKVRGFICTTAHPVGCRENVKNQVRYVQEKGAIAGGKKVLVLGASTGYGLASRICSAFGCGAATVGVAFEKPASGNRTASAGWYNTAAFEEEAVKAGLYAKTIIGDAFSQEIKEKTIALIRADLGQVDTVIYSIAAPRRTAPDGVTYSSVLKPIGETYSDKNIDLKNRAVTNVSVAPATQQEIADTVKVMGGEDWKLWMEALQDAGVLADGAVTVAYSYIGPKVTYPLYRAGTIGMAKEDLEATAKEITTLLQPLGGHAYVSVNKALVTQSSAAIPVVPLYITMLFQLMKEKGLHEDCIAQIYRMYQDKLYQDVPVVDEEGRLRVDDWELREDIQTAIAQEWAQVNNDNIAQYADFDGYWKDFYNLFGFAVDGVDYSADVSADVKIPSVE